MDSCNSQPRSDIALYVINFSGVYHSAERSVRSLECSNANGAVIARGACPSRAITLWTMAGRIYAFGASHCVSIFWNVRQARCALSSFFRSSVGQAADLRSAADVPRAL